MNYKYYYFNSENTCILSLDGKDNPKADLLKKDKTNLIININNKNVENLSAFFKNAVMQAIINEDYIIKVNDIDIQSASFYNETSFAELLVLINDSLDICNKSLDKIKNELNI